MMIGSVILAVSFFIQRATLCMSTAAQIGSWRSTRRESSPAIRGISTVSTQVARSLDPTVGCTSHCGVGEPYSPFPQALLVKESHCLLTELSFPRGIGFGLDGRFYLSSGIGPGGEGETPSPCSHKMESESRHVSSKILSSVRLI